MVKTSSPTSKKVPYENNPFFVATNGIELLFKKAQSVGIALAIVSGLTLLSALPSWTAPYTPAETETATQTNAQAEADSQAFVDAFSAIPVEVWFLIGGIILGIVLVGMFIGVVFRGVSDFTAANLAAGKTVTLRDALRGVFANFWGYVWVLVIAGFKTFLWTLLFIIPGFVMTYRYSLAGVAFFSQKLRGNAAVKESAQLTKGAWLTTYASQSLLNMITFGVIAPLLTPGTHAVLYSQLKAVGTEKPRAHVLSWLTLIIPIILTILTVLAVLAIVYAIANYMNSL